MRRQSKLDKLANKPYKAPKQRKQRMDVDEDERPVYKKPSKAKAKDKKKRKPELYV